MMLLKLILAYLLSECGLKIFSSHPPAGNPFKSAKAYVTAIIHGALAMLFVWNIKFLLSAILITISYAVICLLRTAHHQSKNYRWQIFYHLLHLMVLTVVWYLWDRPEIIISEEWRNMALIIATACVWLTLPVSRLIKIFISQWAPGGGQTGSLQNAGKYIGMLERLFVLVFVMAGHWEAIGFLIAAKSVFRFGDLKESKDRELTEYILIGTLLSFGFALVTSMAVVWMVKHLQ